MRAGAPKADGRLPYRVSDAGRRRKVGDESLDNVTPADAYFGRAAAEHYAGLRKLQYGSTCTEKTQLLVVKT